MAVNTSPLPSTPAEIDSQTGGVTVPLLLANPSRVTRQVVPVAASRYWAHLVLPNSGGVQGGGVVYDLAQPGDNFSAQEPEQIAPMAEFPIINAAEEAPMIAYPAKYGGKIGVSDEKRDRNDVRYVQRELVRATNTMVRFLHEKAVETVDAAATSFRRTGRWSSRFADVAIVGTSPTAINRRPAADIQSAQARAYENDYNVTYDVLLVSFTDYAALQSIYPASEGGVDRGMFPDGGGRVIAAGEITTGTQYLIASNEAGETRWERPLGTESWREEKIETSWIQIGCRVVYFVDNPYAILKMATPS